MSGSEWGANSYAGSAFGWEPAESAPFAGLLGDIFQALDRLEHRSDRDDRKHSHGISVWQLYLVEPPLLLVPAFPCSL
jgi:hypothetical protein